MKFDTCKSCGVTIAWLLTASNKPMPVDAATCAAGDTRFDPARHVSHFATCPHGKGGNVGIGKTAPTFATYSHSKRRRKPKEEDPS